LIAVASVGAALATAEVTMEERLGGKVVLFGTPAEGESLRPIMITRTDLTV
jgi:metal-dependent amidase/aminoacylase/carboxypeptidase family protein